jgi:hypothetical protein
VRQFLKSFKKCGIINFLDGPEDDKLFEESETSDNAAVVLSRTVVMRILGDSVTSRNHILPCHFVEYVFVN